MSLRAKIVLLPLLVVIPLLWILYLLTASPQANDFYPLYFAAQRIVAGQPIYGLEASQALGQQWETPYSGYAQAGVAYPLPLVLFVIPLLLLPLSLATFLWTATGFLTGYLCVTIAWQQSFLQRQPPSYQALSLLVPFTFYPFYRAVELSQATLLWFGLAVLLLLSIRRQSPLFVAMCVVLLMLKPQNGALFAAYGLYWLARHHRIGLLHAAAFGALLLGISLAVQPQWIGEWLQQVQIYRSIVQPPSLLPLGLVALVVSWRLPLWVKVAIAQVVLFPMSDIYSTLPLLLAWCFLTPPVALFGSLISWLWVFLPGPTPLSMMWLLLFTPLMVAILWETRPAPLRRNRAEWVKPISEPFSV